MAKVLLGIPSGGSVKSKTMMTIISVLSMTQHRITVMERDGALGPDNRNHICQTALENGFTHVFLVDADMSFPGDTLDRLVAHRKDLIGAAYNFRQHPKRSVIKLDDGKGGCYSPILVTGTQPFVCYSIGSGCKLVTTQALAHIPRPWFALDFDKDGMLSVSDDSWFCQQARKVGIQTFCDPTIEAKHIGEYEY